MNNIWIQYGDKITNDGIYSFVKVYMDEDEFDSDKNMFPSDVKIEKPNYKYIDSSEYTLVNDDSLPSPGQVFCKKEFEIQPFGGNFITLFMTKDQYCEYLEGYFEKNFRIFDQYLLIGEE